MTKKKGGSRVVLGDAQELISKNLEENSIHAVITDRHTYEEAKECVKLLGITTRTEYRLRYKENEMLLSNPDKYYSEEWEDWPKFLDSGTKGEKITRTNSVLDQDKIYATGETYEFIDGFLLGDGHLRKSKITALLQICQSQKECADYFMSFIKQYKPRYYYERRSTKQIAALHKKKYNLKKYYEAHRYLTKSHSDFTKQHERWYSEEGYRHERKHVPVDVCLSPLSVLMWWLGDGSLKKFGNGITVEAVFYTEGFAREENETILLPKLNKLGFGAKLDKRNYFRLSCRGTLKMLEYIDDVAEKTGGKLKCYSYKFLSDKERSKVDNFKHHRTKCFRNLETLKEICDEKKIQILSPWDTVNKMEFKCPKKGCVWNTCAANIFRGFECPECGYAEGKTKSWQIRKEKYGPSGRNQSK